jgi:hypothetical protein
MLGVLLPKLNIAMTKRSGKKKELDNNFNFLSQYTFDKFEKDIKK